MPHRPVLSPKRWPLLVAMAGAMTMPLAMTGWTPAISAAGPAAASSPTSTAAKKIPTVNRRILDARIRKSSGLTPSSYRRNVLFTHNDTGDRRIFAISRNGRTKAVLRLKGAKTRGWEDIATGPDRILWVVATGDRNRARKRVTVFRFKEPKKLGNHKLKAAAFRFAYPDGAHHAEALMVQPRTGRVHIVSKQRRGAVYVAPKALSTRKVNKLRKVRDAPANVTSAAFHPRGGAYVLGTAGKAHLYAGLRSAARKVTMPPRRKGESIAFNRSGKRLLAGSKGRRSPVFQVGVPAGLGSSGRTCVKAPPYAQHETVFGTSLSTSGQSLAESVADVDSKFGHVPVVRTFDPTIPPEKAWSRRAPVLGDRMIVTSFREHPNEILSGKYDARIRAYFKEAPNNTILYSYFHEADAEIAKKKSFTPAKFKAAFRHVVDIASSLCRDNLYPTLILTGWTANKSSERHWRDYYPGNDYVSVMSWDPYNSANEKPTRYGDPASLYADVLRETKKIGKPWGIAETGSARINGDTSGVERGAWLKQVGDYFSTKGAVYVTYFQSTRDQDFELRDEPSIDAWKAWVHGS